MRRVPIALLLMLSMTAAKAEIVEASPAAADPLRSPACRQALAALQAQEAAAAPAPAANRSPAAGEALPRSASPADRRPTAANPAYAAARRQAAVACLASRADPPPQPQRMAQPPVVVGPLTAVQPMQPLLPSARQASPAPLAPAPAPPHFVLSCDSAGCWADDGSRLNRVGPNLWGSRGVCTLQGALLQCP